MVRPLDIYPEDRRKFRQLVLDIVQELDNPQGPNTTAVAMHVVSALEDAERKGSLWAGRALRALAVEGARRQATGILKEEQGTVRIAHNGAVISLPNRLGTKAVDASGLPQRIFQQPLWWEMSWQQFERVIEGARRQRDRMAAEIAALNEIRRLRERYPDSRTPGEACRQAGIDPRAFGLPEAI